MVTFWQFPVIINCDKATIGSNAKNNILLYWITDNYSNLNQLLSNGFLSEGLCEAEPAIEYPLWPRSRWYLVPWLKNNCYGLCFRRPINLLIGFRFFYCEGVKHFSVTVTPAVEQLQLKSIQYAEGLNPILLDLPFFLYHHLWKWNLPSNMVDTSTPSQVVLPWRIFELAIRSTNWCKKTP